MTQLDTEMFFGTITLSHPSCMSETVGLVAKNRDDLKWWACYPSGRTFGLYDSYEEAVHAYMAGFEYKGGAPLPSQGQMERALRAYDERLEDLVSRFGAAVDHIPGTLESFRETAMGAALMTVKTKW